jgi:DNA replication protein DnaC
MEVRKVDEENINQKIIKDTSQKEETSPTFTIDHFNENFMITFYDAIRLNLVDDNVLQVKVCQFCGQALEPIGIFIKEFNKIIWQGVKRCDCEKAREYWKEIDIKEEQRKENEKNKKVFEEVGKTLEKSKMGKRFYNRTFQNFIVNEKNLDAYEMAKKYAENFENYKTKGIGLMLTGTPGTGKTHLSCGVCHDLLKKGYKVTFGTMINLLGRIKNSYSDDSQYSEANILNEYINSDLLVIDDLGKEFITPWMLEKLYYILNTRYEDCLPIIITSNYPLDKLSQRLSLNGTLTETSEAIVSRLYEMCRGKELLFGDFRKSMG